MLQQSALSENALVHEEYQLGPLRESYQTRVTRSGWVVFCILALLILALFGVAIGFFLWGMLPALNDPFFWSPMTILTSIALPVFCCILVPLGVYWQLRTEDHLITPLRRKIVVSLYANGLIYREGRKRHLATWEQLRSIDRLSMRPQHEQYQIHLENGVSITLSKAIAEVQKLGTAIEQEMVKRLFPQALEDYATHKPIVFPGLCLTQETMGKSDESLPWQAVEQVSLHSSKLTGSEQLIIKERGVKKDWFAAPIAQLRNFCLLEALFAQISKEQHFSLDTRFPQRPRKKAKKEERFASDES